MIDMLVHHIKKTVQMYSKHFVSFCAIITLGCGPLRPEKKRYKPAWAGGGDPKRMLEPKEKECRIAQDCPKPSEAKLCVVLLSKESESSNSSQPPTARACQDQKIPQRIKEGPAALETNVLEL